MSNININYRSALILKHALKDKIESKQKLIESGTEFSKEEIKDLEQEIRTYDDFSSKIDSKWANRRQSNKNKSKSKNKKSNNQKES